MKIDGWQWHMTDPGAPLVRVALTELSPGPDEAVIEIAGCGVCHTDLGFLQGGVRLRHDLPLTLGHEISGFVLAAGREHADWVGKAVVVPAVLPCGDCDPCGRGRGNICRQQLMPGNDCHGGFASHVVVPARGLCEVPVTGTGPTAKVTGIDLSLAELSVMADAISTPFESVERADVQEGDFVVVVGLGGVGGFCAQIARARGARVLGIDPDADRRAALRPWCDAGVLDPSTDDARAVRKSAITAAKELSAPLAEWKIFECSGTAGGQQTAFGLLNHGATLCVIGFTMDRIEVRLSNLMAFDARAIGSWGCLPSRYPGVLDLVLQGRIEIRPFVERFEESRINEAIEQVARHQAKKRPVIVPAA